MSAYYPKLAVDCKKLCRAFDGSETISPPPHEKVTKYDHLSLLDTGAQTQANLNSQLLILILSSPPLKTLTLRGTSSFTCVECLDKMDK